LPGTRFFAAVQHELGAKQNWKDSEDLAMLYRGPFSTSFYRMLHRVLHREFRARKAWDVLRPALRQPWRLRRRHARALAAIGYTFVSLPLLRLELERRARVPHRGLSQLLPVVERASE
jgi:anaerobic magnesium-protoporphyrin IX monomethyl ester cyclase